MTSVYRVRAIWTGFTGSPGYSNFSFQDLATDTARVAAGVGVRAFFNAMVGLFSNTWSIQVQAEVTEYDMSTGHLLGAANMSTVPTAVVGSSTPLAYAGGSGMSIQWNTSLFIAGRRLRGRTYVVPTLNIFDTDGTLSPTALTAGGNAATALISAAGAEFAVWHRLYSAPPGTPGRTQIGGAIAPVDSYTLRDKASQLRSRRN
jgi:hypothetical protein